MSATAEQVIAVWIRNDWDDLEDCHLQPYAQAARRLLTALREAGFAVVPVEPTEDMLYAGVEASDKQRVGPIYRAMLKAAQGWVE